MPVAGQPLPLAAAVAKFSAQSVFGTAVTPATALGTVLAGYRKISKRKYYRGPGSANPQAVKQGSTHFEWSLRWQATQSGVKSFLLNSVRSGGTLPLFTLGIGYVDDTSPTPLKRIQQIQDCVMNQIQLSLAAENDVADLAVECSGFGTIGTVLTAGSKGTVASTPWVSAEGVLTNGSAFKCPQFQVSVNHNVSLDYLIYGSSPGSGQFAPQFLTPHAEVINGSLTRYEPLGADVHALTVVEQALSLVLTNVDDSVTLTVGPGNCSYAEEQEQQTDNGIRWSTNFEGRGPWSLS